MSARVVTVFGSSTPKPRQPAYQLAADLGGALARAGFTVCNGGYGGTMEAAARGAVEAGGHTIGVTCRAFRRGGPNAYIRQEVPTFDLFSRLNTLIRLGDAYVVLPGGTGTLLELAAVLELASKSVLRPARPILILGDFWCPVLRLVRAESEGGGIRQIPGVSELVGALSVSLSRCTAPIGKR